MRILLDEDLPRRLGPLLVGHEPVSVQRAGWSGIKNGKLLALAGTKFDLFLTMDSGLEFQQNLSTLPVAILIVEAVSNRMEHLEPLVPAVLQELAQVRPRTLRRLRMAQLSSPGESHPQALPEPYVNLSIHTAPIVQSS